MEFDLNILVDFVNIILVFLFVFVFL